MLFRTMLACCVGFIFLGYPLSSGLRKCMHSTGILWSIVGGCIISASWYAGATMWFTFMVLELSVIALWSCTMSLGSMPTGPALSYYGKHQRWFDPLEEALGRRLSVAPAWAQGQEAAPHQNATMEGDEEGLRANETRAAICVVVLYLTVCGVVLLAVLQHRCLDQRAPNASASVGSGPPEPAASNVGGAGLDVASLVPAATQTADVQTPQAELAAAATQTADAQTPQAELAAAVLPGMPS